MRRPGFIPLAATLVLSCCALIAASAWADDRPGENQGAKQFSEPAPARAFDLSKIDLSKPPVEPAPPKPPEKENQPKAKPVVRYRAAELVPEGAEIALELPDLTRARRAAGASPLGRLMAADALGPVWSRHIAQRLRNLPPLGEGLPNGDALVELFDRMSDLFAGEAVVAVYPPADGGQGRRLLIVAELEGARRGTLLDTVEDLKALAGLSRETSVENLSKGDFEFQRLTAKSGLTATWGFVGNQLVVELGRAKAGKQLYADLVLSAAVSRGDKSLAREETRAEQMAVLGKDADCYLRADVRSLAGLARPAGRGPAALAGLEGVKYLAAALRFEPEAAREKVFVAMDPDGRLGKLLPKKSPGADLVKFVPLDAFYCEVERLEPGAAAQAFEMFKGSLSEELRNQLDERVAELDKKSGLSLEKEILPSFAGEFASAYVVRVAGAAPEVELLMVIQPDDLDKLKKSLGALERALAGSGEFKSEPYLGAQVHYLEKPKDKDKDAKAPAGEPLALGLGGGAGAGGFSPVGLRLAEFGAYAVHGQCVILGTSARIVKMAVRQRDPAQHTSSLVDKADFKSARVVLGAPANEVSYGYLDLHRAGEMFYSLAGAALELPPADRVLDELSGMAWSLRREKQGISVEVVSPVGLMPLGVAMLAKGTLDAVDAAAAAERAAHTAKLKAIWRGMELFSTEFGRYPLNLSELYPTYVPNAATFLTPEQEAGETKVTIARAEEVDARTGYRYMSGRASNAVGTTVLVYSAKPTVRGTHWCLLVSGKVSEVPAKGLAELVGGRKRAESPSPAAK
jgi:hypothetical protein